MANRLLFKVLVLIGLCALSASMTTAVAKSLSAQDVEPMTRLFLDLAAFGDAMSPKDLETSVVPVLRKQLLVDEMLRYSLGRHYRGLTRAQLRRVKRLYLLATARDLRAKWMHSGVLELLNTNANQAARPLPDGMFLLRFSARRADGEAFDVGFILRKRSDRWRVVNLLLDGASLLALQRARFNRWIENGGTDALLARLKTAG